MRRYEVQAMKDIIVFEAGCFEKTRPLYLIFWALSCSLMAVEELHWLPSKKYDLNVS